MEKTSVQPVYQAPNVKIIEIGIENVIAQSNGDGYTDPEEQL